METLKVTLLVLFILTAYAIAGRGECDSFDDKYLVVRGSAETPKQLDKSQPITIRWVRVKLEDMPVVCSRVIHFVFPIPGINGCYGWKDNICYVYADDTPEGMEVLGHETKHCYDGRFHNTKDWKWLD